MSRLPHRLGILEEMDAGRGITVTLIAPSEASSRAPTSTAHEGSDVMGTQNQQKRKKEKDRKKLNKENSN